MSRLIITIDQTPCRASYGLLGQQALRREIAATQRSVIRENIANIVDRGDRLAKIVGEENSIPFIAGEAYPSEPVPDVVLTPIARPIIGVREAGVLDIVI
jgi:hypothetical protein